MIHRHINQQRYTLAAIDSIIDRGTREDWTELRTAAKSDPSLYDKIRRICEAHVDDPYSPNRYRYWLRHVEKCAPCARRKNLGPRATILPPGELMAWKRRDQERDMRLAAEGKLSMAAIWREAAAGNTMEIRHDPTAEGDDDE